MLLLVPATSHPQILICRIIIFYGLCTAGKNTKNSAVVVQFSCIGLEASPICTLRQLSGGRTTACKRGISNSPFVHWTVYLGLSGVLVGVLGLQSQDPGFNPSTRPTASSEITSYGKTLMWTVPISTQG